MYQLEYKLTGTSEHHPEIENVMQEILKDPSRQIHITITPDGVVPNTALESMMDYFFMMNGEVDMSEFINTLFFICHKKYGGPDQYIKHILEKKQEIIKHHEETRNQIEG